MLPPHAKVAERAWVAREALISSMRLVWDMVNRLLLKVIKVGRVGRVGRV
jgi:hypothetical protein